MLLTVNGRLRRGFPKHRARLLNATDLRLVVEHAVAESRNGRATEAVRKELQTIDRSNNFTAEALRIFQHLLARLGVATHRPILIPASDQPFWLRGKSPLANYQSTKKPSETADVVIIGAGLTGAAAAYRLRNSGRKIIVLDQGDPACEASGRNGGNFELLPENSVGAYEGLAPGRLAYMKRCYPRVPVEVLQAVSERQASLVLGLALQNREILKETILSERIDCDFSPKGWLQIAINEKEEQAICDEVVLAAQHSQRIEIWSRAKIRDEFGIAADFLGRFIPGDGTYHPFKYVCGQLQCALDAGVQLHTRTNVRRIVSIRANEHRIITNRGTIVARRVIVATNAFTRELLPELSAIEPYQSQILITEHAADRTSGRIVTSESGPVFFNQPREGAREGRAPLLIGGGADRPMSNPSSRRRSSAVHAKLISLRDQFYPELVGQPPSTEWVGPMAFTPDGLPSIGFLRPGLVIAAGYNGYGGSYTTAAGSAAADMVITDVVPDSLPEEVFSPRRLLTKAPLFLTERQGLWRIAGSLCHQIQTVNQKIAETLTLQGATPVLEKRPSRQIRRPAGRSRSAQGLSPRALQGLAAFKNFSVSEIRHGLKFMRRWDLTENEIVFTEGSPGGTCFIVIAGEIEVRINARNQQQLVATLSPGSVFGQMSLFGKERRSATCSARTDSIVLELKSESCQRLLQGGTSTALKFLAMLNEGLILALRGADLRLMQLEKSPASLVRLAADGAFAQAANAS